jgi:hypothetical protein
MYQKLTLFSKELFVNIQGNILIAVLVSLGIMTNSPAQAKNSYFSLDRESQTLHQKLITEFLPGLSFKSNRIQSNIITSSSESYYNSSSINYINRMICGPAHLSPINNNNRWLNRKYINFSTCGYEVPNYSFSIKFPIFKIFGKESIDVISSDPTYITLLVLRLIPGVLLVVCFGYLITKLLVVNFGYLITKRKMVNKIEMEDDLENNSCQ